MKKLLRLLYGDNLMDLKEDIQEFKREPFVHRARVTKVMKHRNGHYTAFVWYWKKTAEENTPVVTQK